jgi:hypothetical protein
MIGCHMGRFFQAPVAGTLSGRSDGTGWRHAAGNEPD